MTLKIMGYLCIAFESFCLIDVDISRFIGWHILDRVKIITYHKNSASQILSVPDLCPIRLPPKHFHCLSTNGPVQFFALLQDITSFVLACNIFRTALMAAMIHFRIVTYSVCLKEMIDWIKPKANAGLRHELKQCI